MVLESLFTARKLFKKPLNMFLITMIITLISIFLARLIFPGPGTGKIITLFIAISMTPLIYSIFRIEESIEQKEAEYKIQKSFLERHGETILLFTLFFLGNFVAIFCVSLILPEAYVSSLFEDQLLEIARISSISGSVINPPVLEIILMNNLRVMILSFLLSFLIGTGAVIILSWNASILALYLTSFIRKGLLIEFLVRTVSIVPHAPIEIGAYFLAGIAGGILSVGIIREKIKSRKFLLVFRDSLLMLAFAVIAVTLGAFIEVFL